MTALWWAFSAAINRSGKSSQWIWPLSIAVMLLRLVQSDAHIRGFNVEANTGTGGLLVHGIGAVNTRDMYPRMAKAAMKAPVLTKVALSPAGMLAVHPPDALVEMRGTARVMPDGVATGMAAAGGVSRLA